MFFQLRKCPVLFFLSGFRLGLLTLDVFLVFLGLEIYLSYLLPAYLPSPPDPNTPALPCGAEDDLELLYLTSCNFPFSDLFHVCVLPSSHSCLVLKEVKRRHRIP